MSKKHDPIPEPAAGDTFTVPGDGDSFAPPTPEQEVALWRELRSLLDGLVGSVAGPADRAQADALVRRLGLDPCLCPLFLVALREVHDLQGRIDLGVGQADVAAAAQRECRVYSTVLAASTADEGRKIQAERERLSAAYTVASRLDEASATAERQLRHCKLWLWPLFTPDANPFPETKDVFGNVKRPGGGALSTTLPGPKLAEAAATMEVNPFVIDSWRIVARAEPTPARRRYRTSPLTSLASPVALGQLPRTF